MDLLVTIVENAAVLGQIVFDTAIAGHYLIDPAVDIFECGGPAAIREVYKDRHQCDDGEAGRQEDRAFLHAPCSEEVGACSCSTRWMVARDERCSLASWPRLMPRCRSRQMAARSRSRAGRPMCRPSRRARRMPARTLSTIRLCSSSAIAPMITTMARPSGPPVSICS